jgi:hypothetical protein
MAIFRGAALCLVAAAVCTAQQTPALQADTAKQGAAKPEPQEQAVQPQSPLYQPPESAAPADQIVPDDRPLSGILDLTLGTLRSRQNIVSISFSAGQVFDSNPGVLGQGSDYEGITAFSTNLHVARTTKRAGLNLNYQAGAVVYNGNVNMNWFPQLDLSQAFTVRRWTFSVADHVEYTPEGSQGAGLGFQNYGASLASGGISSTLLPNQTIYTPVASRLSHTVSGQVQYGLSPRSSWTASFSYGTLYYPDGTFANSNQIDVRGGYNRALTARDSITFFYDYTKYLAPADVDTVDSHSVQLGYARRVTGRLSWSVSAGPQISSAAVHGSDGANVSWAVSTTGQYQRTQTGVSFGYSHSVRGGAGVFDQTTTDTAQLGISRTIYRTWTVGASGSISKNEQLGAATEFKSGTAGVQVHRRLGLRAGMYFTYAFQRQVAGGPCGGLLCAGLSRQVFGFGFQWEPRPWVLQ